MTVLAISMAPIPHETGLATSPTGRILLQSGGRGLHALNHTSGNLLPIDDLDHDQPMRSEA
jgi:hypothetical protein